MAFIQVNYTSKALNRMTSFNAFIPIDTFESPEQVKSTHPMKALYLLHGYTGGHFDWPCGARVQELSLKYNVAIFMPCGNNSFYLDDEDKKELFGEYVGRELVEYTRSLFHLSDKSEDTIIGGLSMGGFGAIRNGLRYANNFGHIFALSSALITDNIANVSPDYKDEVADYNYYTRVFGDLSKLKKSDKDPEFLVRTMKKRKTAFPHIYMACGTEDFLLKENRAFHSILLEEDIIHMYVESAGEHNWDFWNRCLELAISWSVAE